MAPRFSSVQVMAADRPTLSIGFAAEATRARLIAQAGLENDLRRLAIGFRTSMQRLPGSVEVELDDLLTNLDVLRRWPYKGDGQVTWDAQLQALVVDSLDRKSVV